MQLLRAEVSLRLDPRWRFEMSSTQGTLGSSSLTSLHMQSGGYTYFKVYVHMAMISAAREVQNSAVNGMNGG